MQFLIGAFVGVLILAGTLAASSQEWVIRADAPQEKIQDEPQVIVPKKESSKDTRPSAPTSTSTQSTTTIPKEEPSQEKPAEEKPTPPQEPKEEPQSPVTSCEGQHEGAACVAFSQGATAEGMCRPGADGALTCVAQ